LVRIRGWKAVAARGVHAPGDTVVYIPQDAVVPRPVLAALELSGKLAGKDKNRVKAIRLRGELSQGLLMPMHVFRALAGPGEGVPGTCVAEALGITRWEEPIPTHLAGRAVPWPAGRLMAAARTHAVALLKPCSQSASARDRACRSPSGGFSRSVASACRSAPDRTSARSHSFFLGE
jgi:hypothetical protein